MSQHDALYLVAAVVLGFLANDFWRVLGALLSARLDESSAVFVWVRMVATALVAGLVAKFIITPTGGLALAPLWLRLGSVGCGIVAYALGRRSLTFGVGTGAAALVLGMVVLGP
ncbi:MAG: branched-chain amino acid transport [Ancylobacter novellus]|uniref:Branched-chain amino acid transport n=1 Tax=Ancylobacter novellus TaxID=921 RepID=A0A2W5KPU9_ANCNO|nr:MAG: branched-chain amino acid transport [Ancylobacter novellus]